MIRFAATAAVLGAGAMCAVPAEARNRDIAPYIEVGQILSADVQNGDVLTYTTVAAGIDASVHSRRAEVQISYRYEHRFSEDGRLTDADIHSGLARASVKVLPVLTLEGGALATRARADQRGAAPGILTGNSPNISQVYSLYAGPTFGSHVGPFGVSAAYRFGYTKVEAPGLANTVAGQPRLDVFDSSRNQSAQASLNLKSGVLLPVGVTVSGGWERDDASQLHQVYNGKFARGDVIWPVLPTLALTAGVGYENIKISQHDALLDATGQPVIDSRGRFQEDPNSPARIAYKFDGIYYDAGVVWKPSPRTHVEAHVGRRYGSISYTGSVSYQASKRVAMAVSVYDGVTTFGRQLRTGLANMPTNFTTNPGGIGGDYNGCTFGAGGTAGGCLNGVFQSISTAAFRARGVDAVVTLGDGPTRYGVGAGYANRRFLAPSGGALFSVDGLTDESYYVQAFAEHALDRRTTLQGTVYANYYTSGIAGAKGIYGVGATASLGRSFGRLSARGTVGVYSFAQNNADAITAVDASIGARYQF
jgi:hypothetical protein